ncbi:APBP2-like protein [Mya arenaria]|uniref:APBP2-like protein n=1 Tax=Mya arenaria TaxID=6604 RepID=A0ABY7E3X0_MYAAR|nr:APBP2-like protein [Mya arenaria]
MASACALEWVPDKLYNMAVSAIVTSYGKYRRELKGLPENVQFDIYYKLYNKGRLCQLGMEFSDLDTFSKVLKVNDKRHLLHHCFQALMDHGVKVSEILADSYAYKCQDYQSNLATTQTTDKTIQLGFALGGFLGDAGWFGDACKVYKACLGVCQMDTSLSSLCKTLECCVRLLHVQNVNCQYQEAKSTCKMACSIIEEIGSKGAPANRATLYTECCALLFAESQYDENALDIRQAVFGGNNLHVAVAHEDLAYASYVQEYSSGRFTDAKDHAEKAIEILEHILPSDHLMLSSSKRVKALILEEIAIDSHQKEMEQSLLSEAQELHLQSLALARKAFGENNVQTAKHYGNLGRLYQSMHKFEKAEGMHLMAIEIKERLLGSEDYEVALSVGHLASLYNYDMEKYDEAENLYLRSIDIGRKLFGDGYSGLEYDYRGLLRLYRQVGNYAMADRYANILQQWNRIRDRNNSIEVKPLEFTLSAGLSELD